MSRERSAAAIGLAISFIGIVLALAAAVTSGNVAKSYGDVREEGHAIVAELQKNGQQDWEMTQEQHWRYLQVGQKATLQVLSITVLANLKGTGIVTAVVFTLSFGFLVIATVAFDIVKLRIPNGGGALLLVGASGALLLLALLATTGISLLWVASYLLEAALGSLGT